MQGALRGGRIRVRFPRVTYKLCFNIFPFRVALRKIEIGGKMSTVKALGLSVQVHLRVTGVKKDLLKIYISLPSKLNNKPL